MPLLIVLDGEHGGYWTRPVRDGENLGDFGVVEVSQEFLTKLEAFYKLEKEIQAELEIIFTNNNPQYKD